MNMATFDHTDALASHRQKVIRTQRIQDFVFEKISMTFAMTTLVVLLGIIGSLVVSAWPALVEFGFPFFYTIEWDIINSKFGGLIAIFGTVVTASIAILIALPLSFGIDLGLGFNDLIGHFQTELRQGVYSMADL
jgi:phosphate transport system permease protein